MALSYNEIAGRSAERLGSLSDGVFAFAMTLLVLDLRVPALELVHSEHDLQHALARLAPNILTYVLSFMTLGIFWVGQHTELSKLKRSERSLTWIHLAFLLAVTMVPFSTKLLAAFITYRTAVIIYWLNILGLGVTLYWSWAYAFKSNLIREDAPAGLDVAVRRRIIVAQAMYAFGAALCFVNTYLSIGFIVLVQLNYVIAPRFGILRRI
jgi:uncharacterized membrane protein